jgi:hypothetical protein
VFKESDITAEQQALSGSEQEASSSESD